MEEKTSKGKSHADEFTVLPAHMSGGPKGLGDPDDRTLRVLENELISKRMREESRKLCVDDVKGFDDCVSKAGFFFFIKCQSASKTLRKCQLNWFNNEEFRTKITEKYLDERAEYRRTGITQKMKDLEKKREQQFEEWMKHQNENKNTSAS
ncbi:uncharacterized protein LOC132714655 [Ruditapes philippinarum]|uniref:uncharacterized protein LOC132714655 n=1 Tax=Ruditapes philippinarum TaxID=129788 RepID=UPI00295C0985|nr:uncharacterized protein LOC132714655 [Ruditapes philippinarum]